MKTKITSIVGSLVIVFAIVGCNSSSLTEIIDPGAKPLEPIRLQGVAKRAMFLICTEDITVPLYTFVVLDRDGKVFRIEHVDERNSTENVRLNMTTGGRSSFPRGFSYAGDYRNGVSIYISGDNYLKKGMSLIETPVEVYPKNRNDVQLLIDQSPKNFAWNKIRMPDLPDPELVTMK